MPATTKWMAMVALSGALFLPACESDTGIPTRSPTCGNEGQVCCAGIGCYDGWTCTQGICRGAAGCTPTAEVCDGRDNDCNAQVDDGSAAADCVARMGANH